MAATGKRVRLTRLNPPAKLRQELSTQLAAVRTSCNTLRALGADLLRAHGILRGLEAEALEGLGLLRVALHNAVPVVDDTKHAIVNAHCDEVAAAVERTGARKVAAIETEQVALDKILEELENVANAVTAAVAADDDALAGQFADLTSRLGRLAADLRSLPTTIMEPLVLHLADVAPDISRLGELARVVAPAAISADDVTATRKRRRISACSCGGISTGGCSATRKRLCCFG